MTKTNYFDFISFTRPFQTKYVAVWFGDDSQEDMQKFTETKDVRLSEIDKRLSNQNVATNIS